MAKKRHKEEEIRVFVYGSLKSNLGNNVLLSETKSKFLGLDSITGPFDMISFGGFPGVLQGLSETKTVFGELWAVDEDTLESLDMLEGHPTWYKRKKYRTDIFDRNAWMYTFSATSSYANKQAYPRVEECIWRPDDLELKFWESRGVIVNA